jgi:hypothetical protein
MSSICRRSTLGLLCRNDDLSRGSRHPPSLIAIHGNARSNLSGQTQTATSTTQFTTAIKSDVSYIDRSGSHWRHPFLVTRHPNVQYRARRRAAANKTDTEHAVQYPMLPRTLPVETG